jgi:hypothetical protein
VVGGVVLEVGVLDDHEGRGGLGQTQADGGGAAQGHPRVERSHPLVVDAGQRLPGAVGGAVVDDDHLGRPR